MSSVSCSEETKFIYYIDEEETPYLVKLNIAPEVVTLGDFKNALNRPHYKFFFKSIDDDFGVVKEEIFDDNAVLPCFNGRVVSWLVTADGSTVSDSGPGDQNDDTGFRTKSGDPVSSYCTHTDPVTSVSNAISHNNNNHTTAAPADSTSASLSTGGNAMQGGGNGATEPDTESVHSANQDRIAPLRSFHNYKSSGRHHFNSGTNHCAHNSHGPTGFYRHRHHHRIYGSAGGAPGSGTYETPSSMLSSDLESTSFFDSEDESSRFSSVTGTTLSSRRYGRVRQRRRRRRPPPISRASSFSSITDSTMSLNIVAVTLNMDTVNFLGISIVGQSNKAGDGGIYVGSIMKGGAVAQDGRIEPGDMILEVNGMSFEEMSNDDAVRTLREQVQRPGPITLVVAKCWDPNPRGGYFTIPRQEPVRPIDPRAWVLHTNAMTDGVGAAGDSQLMNGPPITGASSGGESSSTLSPSGAAGLTPGMSMGTLTSGQTSMPLGTSAAAYNMAALLAATQQQHQQQKSQQQQEQHMMQQHAQMQLSRAQFYPMPNMMIPQAYAPHVAPSVVTASSSLPEIERYSEPIPLTVNTDVSTVIRAMIQPDSGLEIRDRIWLKLTVPNAFIGSDLVDWLFRHLDGFPDRRSARKYAANLLKAGYIRHTVNKAKFSEQCYYVFRDLEGHLSCLSLEEVDSVSEVGALPPPNWGHNTTSTNLTVAGMPAQSSGDFIVPSAAGGMQQQPYTTSTPGPNHQNTSGLSVGECGGTGNSSQYSSVPPPAAATSAPGTHYHPPPLAAPIQQLIADGQDAAAAAAAAMGSKQNRGHNPVGSRIPNKNDISGYSSSSSSTDSELNQFNREPPQQRGSKPTQIDLNQSSLIDPNFTHQKMGDHMVSIIRPPPPAPPPPPLQATVTSQQASSHSQAPSRNAQASRGSASYALSMGGGMVSTACGTKPPADITASSTASSSTSEGPRLRRDPGVTHSALPDNMRLGRGHAPSDARAPQAPALSSKDSSSSSTSSSSNSSCAPLNSRPAPTQTAAVHRLRAAPGHQPNSHAPAPPPRISTAASGFTLTSRP